MCCRPETVRQEMLSDLQGDLRSESWVATLGAIYENIQFSRSIISFMLWLLIAVAAFNLVVSLIMIVRDKRGDNCYIAHSGDFACNDLSHLRLGKAASSA